MHTYKNILKYTCFYRESAEEYIRKPKRFVQGNEAMKEYSQDGKIWLTGYKKRIYKDYLWSLYLAVLGLDYFESLTWIWIKGRKGPCETYFQQTHF